MRITCPTCAATIDAAAGSLHLRCPKCQTSRAYARCASCGHADLVDVEATRWACPACSRQHAVVRIPFPGRAERQTRLKEALDVNPRNVTRWVSFAIAILSLGLPAFIGGAIEGQPLFSIGRALVLTVPLTVSLAIIAHQWWPGAGRSLHPLAACFVIIIAGSWGLSLGLPGSLTPADVAKKDCVDASRIYQREGAKICALKEPLVKAPSWLPAREIVTPALSYLAGYWKVYGPTRFITSVVVALYLAYVVDHYLKL